jgi:RimJ/RimL family protein N-acetyltransferase
MTIRKLFPDEAPKLAGHLARLTHDERALRFMGGLDDEAVEAYCERLNWFRTVVLGFFDEGVLRGAVELHVADSHFPILCEAALTVETAWQDHGTATELLRRALVIARNRSARAVQLNCIGDNFRIQHVAQKFGAHFCCDAGQSVAEIATAAPTYLSVCQEVLDDALGWMNLWSEQISPRRPAFA